MNGNGWSSKKVLLLALLVALLAGCSQEPRITGQVSDEFGKPVSGATVQIQGTTLGGLTDSAGKYSVPYVPGNITVDIQKQGFTSAHFSLSIATPMQYPAATVTLVPIPPIPGFYLFRRSDYQSLYYPAAIGAKPVESVKRMTFYADSNFKDEEYSVYPSGGAVPTFPSGHLKFVDSVNLDTNFFKLVRVGENGRILYRKRVMEERVKDFISVIPEQIRTVDQVLIREADLEPGHYAYVAFTPQRVNMLQALPTPLETGYEFWVK
jgi:carboxypeptidase family protein